MCKIFQKGYECKFITLFNKIIELLKKKNLSVKLENGVVMLTYDFEHKEEQIEKFCSLLEELIITVALGTEGRLLWTNKILKK